MSQETITRKQKEEFGCNGHTIPLLSGGYLDLLNPQPHQVFLSDIATALSNICRFGGQVKPFYSVAEHSYWCCHQAEVDGLPDEVCAAALLHDASEAFLGDAVKPLKILLDDYRDIERRFDECIEVRFGVKLHHPAVKQIDRGMLIHERRHLLRRDGVEWTGEKSVRPISVAAPSRWEPQMAESVFLTMANKFGLK